MTFDDVTIDRARVLGYAVEEAVRTHDWVAYRVSGHGLDMVIRSDDGTTLASVTDPAAHAERDTQVRETRDQTTRRWVRERRVPPPSVQDVT